jgi:molybdenum cofactor guanylyltransferase
MTPYPRHQITAVVLAGGRARRMGGQDKGLVELNGKPMVEYVLSIVEAQAGAIVINANRSLDRYAHYGYPVIADELSDFQGPLAGMASCMARAATSYILTAPCDSPLLPEDLGPRLYEALIRGHADIAVAYDGARMQPVFSLLKRDLRGSLIAFLTEGERKIDLWYARHRMVKADFADRPETFLNINTPQECAALSKRLAAS